VTRFTFVGSSPYPARRNDWEALAATARALLDAREEGYPGLVAAGKLAPADADRRLRIMRAVAAQWGAVVEQRDLPDVADYRATLGADWAEMEAELDAVAARAAELAARRREDRTARDQADLAAALRWHELPSAPGSGHPHIHVAHEYAQWERARPVKWDSAA
jgi:hypothetical protein